MPAPDFRPSDAPLFDNAVDLIEAPAVVEGGWTSALERRVGRADLIAVVRVDALSSDFVSRRSSYRLTVKVKSRLKGSSSRELVLRVADAEPGYETVRVNEDRLLEGAFVVFLKWAVDPESPQPIARWHLSPGSDAVREKIDYFLRHPMEDERNEVEVVEP
ncbi:MAG: hypothetical protein KJO40_00880 [Deltaproteobacteria bacterium]|nr:hypothetical protein [Deltaproteobacteria bacterium]NND27860.1 hypothetical protein [Myxococcales bacterium]MBT8464486.1 hypothetical protein [Deltaproteobacteria bacterium]MBT8482448.1 hypothetical protein [Deltaproteobacteria bacterium]NNK07986.1 hypothetical protein [Myxococcales bacterium]